MNSKALLISHLTRTAAGLGLGIYSVHLAFKTAGEASHDFSKAAVDVANVYAKNGGALPLNHYSDNGIVGRPGGSKP